MTRRRKPVNRAGVALLVIAAATIGIWLWSARHRDGGPRPPLEAPRPAESAAAGDGLQQLKGRLEVIKPPRDADLGVSAQAVVLLRSVAMYEWQEHCDGGRCSYSTGWTAQHIDSNKFRSAAGHANPAAPFANARFLAGEVRIGDVVIDPKLVVEQHAPVEHAVAANALPPNLAATFSVVDGVLYAGGEPGRPRPGMIRISYRVVPAGEITVSGVRRGNRLESP